MLCCRIKPTFHVNNPPLPPFHSPQVQAQPVSGRDTLKAGRHSAPATAHGAARLCGAALPTAAPPPSAACAV